MLSCSLSVQTMNLSQQYFTNIGTGQIMVTNYTKRRGGMDIYPVHHTLKVSAPFPFLSLQQTPREAGVAETPLSK